MLQKTKRAETTGENWVVRAPGTLDRIEAKFSGKAFATHRHDTYAIGVTLAGVQAFDYRGATRRSLPGQMVVLHPDETHDGRAGSEDAFHYRTLYLEPALLQTVLQGRPLPFVKGGVSTDQTLRHALLPLLEDYHRPLDAFEYQDALCGLAAALNIISDGPEAKATRNYDAANLARAYLDTHLEEAVTLEDLETAARHDRWQLSRDFRAVFGTSPYRYLILRRLDKARRMLVAGHGIADAASACAFADQSHFTRQFKKAFGVTPKSWQAAMR
jgi:AraC-like DNA-binding protein